LVDECGGRSDEVVVVEVDRGAEVSFGVVDGEGVIWSRAPS
jgi:hypothetical protein